MRWPEEYIKLSQASKYTDKSCESLPVCSINVIDTQEDGSRTPKGGVDSATAVDSTHFVQGVMPGLKHGSPFGNIN
tara:strand:- start:137 stop:364 length:228 start_codon:yes stop_codon:yes gene_type:complete